MNENIQPKCRPMKKERKRPYKCVFKWKITRDENQKRTPKRKKLLFCRMKEMKKRKIN